MNLESEPMEESKVYPPLIINTSKHSANSSRLMSNMSGRLADLDFFDEMPEQKPEKKNKKKKAKGDGTERRKKRRPKIEVPKWVSIKIPFWLHLYFHFSQLFIESYTTSFIQSFI